MRSDLFEPCLQPGMCTVEHRGTHGDLLHRVVERGAAELRQVLNHEDRDVPAFGWRELERCAGCGDLRRGFAWLVCDPCDHHGLVPFSCTGSA
jgi:Transposase zinc-binding domain